MTSRLRQLPTLPWHWLSNRIDSSPVSKEQKHQLYHYTIFLTLGIPVLVGFGIYNLFVGEFFQFFLVMSLSALLAVSWYMLGRVSKGQDIQRVVSTVFAVFLLYLLAAGAQSGSTILWLYTYPLFIFFLLGVKEGFIWSVSSLAIAGVLLYAPPDFAKVHPYSAEIKARFMVTYLVVSVICLWFQYLRHQYFVTMEERQVELESEHRRLERVVAEREAAERAKGEVIRELQTALDQVKTLSGLIPVCANCHKIRDDEGFWDQMESYIARHSEAQFSHGICPDCMETLYPEYRRAANGD